MSIGLISFIRCWQNKLWQLYRSTKSSGRNKVALSGGVFQNRLLLHLTEERLMKEGFEVLRHRMIPPNDGGIAIGQAAYGMHWLQKDI